MSSTYVHTEDVHNFRAPREVVPLVLKLINPASILDVGCGIGTWLKVFEEHGVADYLGVDGDFVDRDLLKIDAAKFKAQNLKKPWSVHRMFDLVISLEVAEHLPEESADLFVRTLTSHSDTILFSAAIPGQGGQNHLNEQWPSYWQEKFENHGFFCHDVFRPLIWDNEKIDWWYRQNMMLITKSPSGKKILSLVHPECVAHIRGIDNQRIQRIFSGSLGIMASVRILLAALSKKLSK